MSIQGPNNPPFPQFPDNAPWQSIGEIKIGEATYRVEFLALKLSLSGAGSVYTPVEKVAEKVSNNEEVRLIIHCLGERHLRQEQQNPGQQNPDQLLYRQPNQVIFHAGYAKIDNEEHVTLIDRFHGDIKGKASTLIPYPVDFHKDRLEKISNELALYEAALSRIFGGRRVILQQVPHTHHITQNHLEAIRARHSKEEIEAIQNTISHHRRLGQAETALCEEIMRASGKTDRDEALRECIDGYLPPQPVAAAPPAAAQPGFFRKMWNKLKSVF